FTASTATGFVKAFTPSPHNGFVGQARRLPNSITDGNRERLPYSRNAKIVAKEWLAGGTRVGVSQIFEHRPATALLGVADAAAPSRTEAGKPSPLILPHSPVAGVIP